MQIGEEERAKLKNFSTDQLIDLLFLLTQMQLRKLTQTAGISSNELNSSQTKKEIEISENSGIFRVVSCKIQEARLKKGLQIFPCKRVRFGSKALLKN